MARLRIFPFYGSPSEMRKAYANDPGRFGKDVAKKGIRGNLRAQLERLKDGKTTEPFLVISRAFPTCLLSTSYSAKLNNTDKSARAPEVSNTKWYITDSTYDLIASALLSVLGVDHRLRDPTRPEAAHRDYFTAHAAEIDQFSRDIDIPRRWRQAIPALRLVDEPDANGLRTARYAIYVCIENPIRDPIWVLPVHPIIDALTDEEKKLLRASRFSFFDHWDDRLTSRMGADLQKVLGGERETLPSGASPHFTKWLSFDANQIDLGHTDTSADQKAAFGKLRHKILELCETYALPIILHRGDALVVDNYRALIRRTELPYRVKNDWLWRRPPVRWIRMYCGFPRA